MSYPSSDVADADQPVAIYRLLPKVMEEIGAIQKGRKNDHHDYLFRGIDDALNHCGPILAKHGISVSARILDDYSVERITVSLTADKERVDSFARLRMAVTFFAPDGSSVENILAGEGQDFGGDKATNKAMAAAMKYGLFFGLVIPVGEKDVDDSDRDRKEYERPKPPQQAGQSGPPNHAGPEGRSSGGNQRGPSGNDRICPECGKETLYESRDDGSYFCWKKKGGCGRQWPAGLSPAPGADRASPSAGASANVGGDKDDPAKKNFWAFCKSLLLPPEVASPIWTKYGKEPDRAKLQAWVTRRSVSDGIGIEEQTIDQAWEQHKSFEPAKNAIEIAVDTPF